MDFDEEGVVDFRENIAFCHDALALLLLLDVFLLHGLEGIELSVCPLADEHHLCVSTLADH